MYSKLYSLHSVLFHYYFYSLLFVVAFFVCINSCNPTTCRGIGMNSSYYRYTQEKMYQRNFQSGMLISPNILPPRYDHYYFPPRYDHCCYHRKGRYCYLPTCDQYLQSNLIQPHAVRDIGMYSSYYRYTQERIHLCNLKSGM
jgi:hypothetical protein